MAESLSLEDACAVWEMLHYLLRALLGWDDPGRGLSWWYAHGKPVEGSPLLAGVARWWDKENLIDFYAAWAWKESLRRFRQGRASAPTRFPWAGMPTNGGGKLSGGVGGRPGQPISRWHQSAASRAQRWFRLR